MAFRQAAERKGDTRGVQSQQIRRVVAAALAATAVAAVIGIPQAGAVPVLQNPPTSSSDALAQYRQLAAQAEQLNEQKLQAQDDYNAKQADLAKANNDLQTSNLAVQKAQANEASFQTVVDQFANQAFVGDAQFAKLSALLSGTSTQDFLDRSSALAVLANDKDRALQGYTDAVNAATAAEN